MTHYSKLEPLVHADSLWESQSDDVEEKLLPGSQPSIRRKPTWSWLSNGKQSIVVHAILLLANLSVLTVFAFWRSPKGCSAYIEGYSSPLEGAVRYESRPFRLQPVYIDEDTVNPDSDNDLNGPPREELEKAWSDLLQHQDVRVQFEELGQFKTDDAIVGLSDEEGGYWSTVSVFHGLHCLERIHHYIYYDNYYQNLTDTDAFTLKRHTEHCVDWLRHYVQCNADLTLIPIQWIDNLPTPSASDLGNHRCANWDSIHEWVEDRSFKLSKPGQAIHPKLGDAYEYKLTKTGPALGIQPLGSGGGLLHGGNGVQGNHDH